MADKFEEHTRSRLMIEELEKALYSIENQLPEKASDYMFADEVNESFDNLKRYINKIVIPSLRNNLLD